ncbi:MAG: hypothetical protein WCT50_04600 [Patescibacteria group bacterium]|jgi:hypothetical protein
MNIIKYKTERVDSGRMVYGCGRPIGVHYTKPIEPDEEAVFCQNGREKFYLNYSEVKKLFRVIIGKCKVISFFFSSNIAITFDSNYEKEYLPMLAPKYWKINNDTYFWSTESGNSRQANRDEVDLMIKKLCPANPVFENERYVLFSIGSPKGQKNLFGVCQILYDKLLDKIKFMDSLPAEYLIDQFSSGFCNTGKWEHSNGLGKHSYDGNKRRWSASKT